jgi:hypothetical protein
MNSAALERRLTNASRQIAAGSQHANDPVTGFEADDNIVRFAADDLGLDLYPRQATLLKVITCAEDLFTDFDQSVIAEWMGGYHPVASPDGGHFEGIRGTPPDLYERIRWCREHGRRNLPRDHPRRRSTFLQDVHRLDRDALASLPAAGL